MRGPLQTVAALICAGLVFVAETRTLTSAGGVDVVTYHNDNARTGQNLFGPGAPTNRRISG